MDVCALKKQSGTSQDNLKDQDDRSMLKAKSLNSGSMEIFSKVSVDLLSSSQLCSKYSKPVSTLECSSKSKIRNPQESAPSFQNVEPKKLLEDANEIINLMDKDYGSGGYPRQKPPINNNHPLNQELP